MKRIEIFLGKFENMCNKGILLLLNCLIQ